MDISDKSDCATCLFFIAKGDTGSGDCRRHAPAVTTFTETNGLGEVFHTALTSWPQVGEADGCGDWKQGWEGDAEEDVEAEAPPARFPSGPKCDGSATCLCDDCVPF